jgi:transcriptional repressor NrdR
VKCPYCGSEELKTLETRDSPENTTRRRKECSKCGKRFTTYEYVETVELMVRKKDGKLERFDVNKIIRGLQKACEKRPVTMDQIHALADRVRGNHKPGDRRLSHEIPEKIRPHRVHQIRVGLQAV